MKYVNEKTGKIIDVQSAMGGAWTPVKAPAKEEKKPATKKKGTKKK